MDYTIDDVGGWGGFKMTQVAMYRYFSWLKDPNSPWAPPDAEKRYRASLCKVAAKPDKAFFTEWGTHNRVWSRYAGLKVARLVAEQDHQPIDPRVIAYTDYHDKIIGDVGDDDDASAGYHWVFWDAAMTIYFHTGDWKAFLDNRGFQKTLSRYVEMVSPSGAVPPFMSCSGWPEVGASMWAYEWMSNLTKNGRYRWTSQRIAEWYYNYLDARANQYHMPYDNALNNFCLAYLLADDSVPPTPPPAASRFTWRHPWLPTPPEEMKAHPTWMMRMDSSQWIPDKLVLSSGTGPLDMWGLVELLPTAGHGGELPGNIIALIKNDSALFAGQGYYENTPDFQNLMWVEDLEGVPSPPGLIDTTVPIFVEDQAFTLARIQTTNYQHLPITYTRDLLFNKNGFLVVKDRVKFDRTMKVRLGPCYYARNLGPQCGANWFNAYYDKIYYTGLGLGRGVQVTDNPAWDLLIYFCPRERRKQTVLDRFGDNPYRNSPVQVRQVWSGMMRAGQEITFTSVLLPHAPVLYPQDLLTPSADSTDKPRLEVLADDDGVTGVKIISDNGPGGARKETWVLLNTTGQPAEAGPLSTDALLAVVTCDATGKVTDRALVGGTKLQFIGVDESANARKVAPIEVRSPGY
jgi:Fe-S-cluster formation regulator IscX/YfhJ